MFGIADNHRVPSTPHPIASAIGLVAQDDRLENSALHIESLSDRSVPSQAPRFAHYVFHFGEKGFFKRRGKRSRTGGGGDTRNGRAQGVKALFVKEARPPAANPAG